MYFEVMYAYAYEYVCMHIHAYEQRIHTHIRYIYASKFGDTRRRDKKRFTHTNLVSCSVLIVMNGTVLP